MPFETITHVKLNKKTGEPLRNTILKVYKTCLDHIAEQAEELTTIDGLIEHANFVVEWIDGLKGDDANGRQEKRTYLSAVFYALEQRALEDKLPYYEAFQKVKQNYGMKNEESSD